MSASASTTAPGGLSAPRTHPSIPPILYVVFGVVLLLIPLVAIILRPGIESDAPVYLRVIAACGGALIGAVVPGLLNVRLTAVKAGGALGVFAVVFFLNPPQTINAAKYQTDGDARYGAWTTARDVQAIPGIPKPDSFPLRFSYVDPTTKRKGRLVYDHAKRAFVEHTGFPMEPFFFFRPVRYENNTLWLYDDRRGFTLRVPERGGVCALSSEGIDGRYTDLYPIKVEKRA